MGIRKAIRSFGSITILISIVCILSQPAFAQTQDPITYIGHGGFFNAQGKQVQLTQPFITSTQAYYRQHMLHAITKDKRQKFAAFEKKLLTRFKVKGQAQLIIQNHILEWLYANLPDSKKDPRLLGKIRALAFAMNWEIPLQMKELPGEFGKPFKLDPAIAEYFSSAKFKYDGGIHVLSATTNQGQAYINECIAAQVPIPPPIGVLDPAGTAGWKSQGMLAGSDQFIVGTPAEVRTYSSPQGMCYALPRYTNSTLSTVALDGVICMSKITSKVCIWDNQMNGSSFQFAAGDRIPIGVPDTAVDPAGRYQAGGFELSIGNPGGICTDCHAGENPYIIHPQANLTPVSGSGSAVSWGSLGSAPQNLPTFAPNRYDPFVAAAWPQNQASQAQPTVPSVCVGCHVKGVAGRFPHLSNELTGYCGTVLTQAISRTMPPGSPGSASGNADVINFKNTWCNNPPDASSADTGDPHITTTNGINYDFQAAGEFTALKNSDTGFELQTRQSPVLTSFTPGVNPYTGLASCVSLNTAVALRIGKHRVTYEPAGGVFANKESLQLRINGKLISQTGLINLGGGNTIVRATSGELDVRLADQSRYIVSPVFWQSQGYWYLDVQVINTQAREGIMGHIYGGDWLPKAPDGSSFGTKPVALSDRHQLLNHVFADAWRVSKTTSMFDYTGGKSSADFTDRNWPAKPGGSCAKTTIQGKLPQVKEPNPKLARRLCGNIKNPTIRANCLFDVTVMGDAAIAKQYIKKDKSWVKFTKVIQLHQ